MLFTEKLFVLKDVIKVLLEAGASLSIVDKEVIKHLANLRQTNIKPFK